MDTAFEHEIRQRAYEMWVASGMNEGEAETHWLHAERAVRTEAQAATVSTAKGKAKPAASKTAAKDAVAKTAKTRTAKTKTADAKTKAAASKAAASKASAGPRRAKAGPIEAVA